MDSEAGFRVMTWNLKGAFPPKVSKERIRKQVNFIDERVDSPDLLMSNEVNTARRDFIKMRLGNIGYSEIVDTLDWAAELGESDVPAFADFSKVNGNLTAVHDESSLSNLTRCTPSIKEEPFGSQILKHWDTNFPEKILNAEVEYNDRNIDLWNIRTVPSNQYGEEKIKILENAYHRMLRKDFELKILAGDFNAPKDELDDCTVVSECEDKPKKLRERWCNAELNVLAEDRLKEIGMVETFRWENDCGELNKLDVSFPIQSEPPSEVAPEKIEGRRFDHIIASRELNPSNCHYDPAAFEQFDSNKQYSDHAPELVTFSP